MNDFTQDPSLNKLSTNTVFNKVQPDFLKQLPTMKRCEYIAENFRALDMLDFVYDVRMLKDLYAAQDRLVELVSEQLQLIDALSPVYSFDALAEYDVGIRWGIAAVLDVINRMQVQILDIEPVVRGWLDGTGDGKCVGRNYLWVLDTILSKYTGVIMSIDKAEVSPMAEVKAPYNRFDFTWSLRRLRDFMERQEETIDD